MDCWNFKEKLNLEKQGKKVIRKNKEQDKAQV
jgi:hypothetical protein